MMHQDGIQLKVGDLVRPAWCQDLGIVVKIDDSTLPSLLYIQVLNPLSLITEYEDDVELISEG